MLAEPLYVCATFSICLEFDLPSNRFIIENRWKFICIRESSNVQIMNWKNAFANTYTPMHWECEACQHCPLWWVRQWMWKYAVNGPSYTLSHFDVQSYIHINMVFAHVWCLTFVRHIFFFRKWWLNVHPFPHKKKMKNNYKTAFESRCEVAVLRESYWFFVASLRHKKKENVKIFQNALCVRNENVRQRFIEEAKKRSVGRSIGFYACACQSSNKFRKWEQIHRCFLCVLVRNGGVAYHERGNIAKTLFEHLNYYERSRGLTTSMWRVRKSLEAGNGQKCELRVQRRQRWRCQTQTIGQHTKRLLSFRVLPSIL